MERAQLTACSLHPGHLLVDGGLRVWLDTAARFALKVTETGGKQISEGNKKSYALSISCVKIRVFLSRRHLLTRGCVFHTVTCLMLVCKRNSVWFISSLNILKPNSKVDVSLPSSLKLKKNMLTTDSNILWNQCGFVVSCRGTVWHALSRQVQHARQ